MKKLKNTTTNKLLVIGGTVALTSAIGYYVGKKNGDEKTLMYAGAFVGLLISQGVIVNVVDVK
jgi:hypothetical protein